MPRRATSQDVADLAGVSRSAVSLVLNGRAQGNIAADKQALILEAARRLNYTPNTVALSLRSRRSSTIGVVTDTDATPALDTRLLQGASDTAEREGYLLLVIDGRHDPLREQKAYETLQNRQVDGLVYAAGCLRPYAAPDLLRQAPSALVNCFDPAGAIPAFLPDEVAGSRAATDHLISHGHRDIVMITGASDVTAGRRREQGYAEALAAAGLPAATPVPGGGEIDAGYAAAMHVLTTHRSPPTAIFCADDRAAIGVLLAAAQLGIAVPRDLSVVGYGDDDHVAPHLVPALTSVRLPYRELGERAVRLVLDAVLDDSEPTLAVAATSSPPELLECPLVIRDSVAPPRG